MKSNLALNISIVYDQCSDHFRQSAVVGICLAWAVGAIYITFLFQYVDHYQNVLMWGIAVPCVVLNLFSFWIVDSPSQVIYFDKKTAEESINYIGKVNNCGPSEKIILLPELQSQ